MNETLSKFLISIDYSRRNESTCLEPVPPPPTPGPPALLKQSGKCLIAEASKKHALLHLGPCSSTEPLAVWEEDAGTKVIWLNGTELCIKSDDSNCKSGATIWLGPECKNDGFGLNKDGTLVSNLCVSKGTPSCLASNGNKIVMDACTAKDSQGWTIQPEDN